MTVSSGRQCAVLSKKPGPLGFLLRTCLESSEWNSTVCSLIWKRSDISAKHLLFRLVPLMPSTAGTGFGLWPTPNVPNGGRTMTEQDALAKGATEKGKRQVGLENAVKFWPTPRANDAEKRGDFDANNPRNGLPGAVKMFPTPTSRDWKSGKSNQHGRNARPLNEVVKLWATPHAGCGTGAGTQGREGGANLQTQVKMFPTPNACSGNNSGRLDEWGGSKNPFRGTEEGAGQLNPNWVEWLQG